jgi:hypothetical protein
MIVTLQRTFLIAFNLEKLSLSSLLLYVNCIDLNMHASTEDKSDGTKDSFYEAE